MTSRTGTSCRLVEKSCCWETSCLQHRGLRVCECLTSRHETLCDSHCLIKPNSRHFIECEGPLHCLLQHAILSHTNPRSPIIISNILFNIILRSTPEYWKLSRSLRFSYQGLICVFTTPMLVLCPLHPTFLNLITKIILREQHKSLHGFIQSPVTLHDVPCHGSGG